jgi:hypothetical protein
LGREYGLDPLVGKIILARSPETRELGIAAICSALAADQFAHLSCNLAGYLSTAWSPPNSSNAFTKYPKFLNLISNHLNIKINFLFNS